MKILPNRSFSPTDWTMHWQGPGRIDYRLFLGKAAEEQKVELYLRFFPRASPAEAEEFVAANRSAETMAEFQGLLLGLDQDWPEELKDREVLDAIREE